MRTPDGHGRLELTKFRNPKLVEIEPAIAPPNANAGCFYANTQGLPPVSTTQYN